MPLARKLLLLLVPFALVALILWQPLRTAKPTTTTILNEHPSAYEDWFDQKENKEGKIPGNQLMRWLNWDREHGNYDLSKKSEVFREIQELGPSDVGGRTRAILVDSRNDERIFAGAVSGGLWLSEDGGKSWEPLIDELVNIGVSCICQNPLNPDEIYIGTGEASGASAGIPGNGVFKSSDGGKTFQQLPLLIDPDKPYDAPAIWSIQHSPIEKNTIYVGTYYNGLWRSKDGGNSWNLMFEVDGASAASSITDIELFEDGHVLMTRYWTGVYHSNSGDSGTYTHIKSGLGTNQYGRAIIEKCEKYPDVVYMLFAFKNNDAGVFFKSSDGGLNWTVKTDPRHFYQGNYCVMLGVHPTDSNQIISGGVGSKYSGDGGQTWQSSSGGHADQHSFASFNQNTDHYLIGNDGGVYKKYWRKQDSIIDLNQGYKVTQFYGGNCFPSGRRTVGGTQDNGSYRLIGTQVQKIGGYDGGIAHVSFQNENLGYYTSQNGSMTRISNIATSGSIKAPITGIGDSKYFISPYELNPTDGTQLYFLTRKGLWRSKDSGDTWKRITTKDISVYNLYATPDTDPTVYMGGKKGALYRIHKVASTNGGNEVDFSPEVPEEVKDDAIGWISGNPDSLGLLFISFNNYSDKPKIYRVQEAHTSDWIWTNITGDLPEGLPVNSIHQDRYNPAHFYAATDFGLYYSTNGGMNWKKEDGIPNVSIHQMRYRHQDSSLFLFTHGRGIWYVKIGQTPVGIGKTDLKEILLYPNPIQIGRKLHIQSEEPIEEIRVYSLNGRLVQQIQNPSPDMKLSNISKPGTYFLVGTIGNETFIRRVLIQ